MNRNQEALTVEEVWTVDGQFSIWIDDVSEISEDIVKKEYGEDWETEKKRYFDVSFSFENIGFPGCMIGDTAEKYLSVRVTAVAIDENVERVWPTTLQVYDQNPCQTVWQKNEKVLATSGMTLSDDHLNYRNGGNRNYYFIR